MIKFYPFLLILSFSIFAKIENYPIPKTRGPCKRTFTTRECNNRRVCRTVCTAIGAAAGARLGGSRGAAAGVGGATNVCNEVCSFVPDCNNVTRCAEYF